MTTAADIYGLGAVLYALLTGRPPFCGPTMHLTLEAVRHLPPTAPRSLNPRVDRDLETVCLKCLDKDPARRYATADDLADDLDRWLRREPVLARRAPLGRKLLALCRRYPASAALAAAAAVFVPALIATLMTAIVSIGVERDRAVAQETLAELREKDVTRQLYAADMTLAHRDWLLGDVNSLKHLLDRWRPAPGREDFRDAAWRILAPLQSADALYPSEVEPTGQACVYHMALSPDGKTMATAGQDGTVRIRRAGEKPVYLRGHKGEVNWVAFDRDGKRLVSASDDGTARIWDPATGAQILKIDAPVQEVVAAEFTTDGKQLVIGGSEGMVRICGLSAGAAHRDLPAGTERVCGLAIAPDGRSFAAGTKDGRIRVWDLKSGDLRYEEQLTGQAQCLAYSPDGKTLAAGDMGGHVCLFDAANGETLQRFKCDNGCSVEGVAFSRCGGTLASCGHNGRVRLWDLRRARFRRNLDCEDVRVWCVAFSPDRQFLLTGAADGAIRKWELSTAHAARFLPADDFQGICSLAFSPDSATLALAGTDGAVTFWDPHSCRAKPDRKPIVSSGQGNHLVQFEGNQLIVCGPDAALERWTLDRSSAPQHWEGAGHGPSTVCCRPNTNEWLTCLAGSVPLVRDLATDKTMKLDPVGNDCSAAAWSPDGKLLAVSVPGRVRILRDGSEPVVELPLSGHSIAWPAVAFSPDGKVLAAVDHGAIVHLWSTADWRPRLPLEGRQISVHGIAFSPCGKVLAVGGEDGTVKIWHVASSQELFTLTTRVGGRIVAVAFAPDGSCLAAASHNHDGTNDVALWPAPAP
jgi:WD40 repeat protein